MECLEFLTQAGRDRVALCDWRPWTLGIEGKVKLSDCDGINWVDHIKWFEWYGKV